MNINAKAARETGTVSPPPRTPHQTSSPGEAAAYGVSAQ